LRFQLPDGGVAPISSDKCVGFVKVVFAMGISSEMDDG